MAGINLLPWRAQRRKQKQQEFFSVTALCLLLSAALLALMHVWISGLIEYQNQRNEYLKSEVSVLEQKIKEIEELDAKKKRLVAKMDVIQQLQLSRPEIVHLFDALSRTMPDGVTLLDLSQTDRSLVINGIAQSNARVSAYMRNIELSPWLMDPVLTVIEVKTETKDKQEGRGSKFTLQVKQSSADKQKTAGTRP
jgi:type IV pilus assembly protein PilN